MKIRPAVDADLDAVLEIHNAAIRDSLAIWSDTEVDRSDRERWLAEQNANGHPVIVAEINGAVAGYASYSQWRSKTGYRHTVENSVYVHPDAQGRGLGKALMVELLDRATADGHHVMLALIEAENTSSIALHTKLGFEQVGLLPEVGTKFGRWLDLAILRRTLA